MRGPIRTCTSHDLLSFIRKGDYKSYMAELAQYDFSEPDWFRFQILALRALTYSKSIKQTFELARHLSQSQTKSAERQLAQAEFLFISWLQFGRRQADLRKLEALLSSADHAEFGLQWEQIRLRTRAMKIMLGLTCASEKSAMLEHYQQHVDSILQSNHEEAFFCLQELIELTLAKPFSNIGAAIKLVDQNIDRQPFQNQPYYRGVLLAKRALLATEVKIRNGHSPNLSKILWQAEQELGLIGNKRMFNAFRVDYGVLLLRYGYGINKGRKVLVQAIRQYQKMGSLEYVRVPINALLSWQKVTGSHNEQGRFQYLASRAMESQTIKTILPVKLSLEEHDEALKRQFGLFQAQNAWLKKQPIKAKALLSHLEEDGRQKGLSYLSLRIKALSIVIDLHLSAEKSNNEILEIASLLNDVGYLQDALDFLTQVLFSGFEGVNTDFSIHDLDTMLAFVMKQSKSKRPDTYLSERIGCFYEVISLQYLRKGDLQKAYEQVKCANRLYERCFLRPKMAFNLLYQAQLLRLFYCQSKSNPHKSEGLIALQEASSLFRLMSYKQGEAKAQENKAHFEEHYFDSRPLNPFTVDFLNAQKTQLNTANAQSGEGTFYGIFEGLVESQLKGISFFQSHLHYQN